MKISPHKIQKLEYLKGNLECNLFVPFWEVLDLDRRPVANLLLMFAVRLGFSMVGAHSVYHPDEVWQSLEVAYDMVYGKRYDPSRQVEVLLSWEFLPHYSLRNYIYPIWLALPAFGLKAVGLDSNLLVVNSMYFMHCILWTMGSYYLYYLVKLLAGKRCALLA